MYSNQYSQDDFSHLVHITLTLASMTSIVPPYPSESAARGTTVAVTGCTGYVAGSIVQRLLELGATVHGTCRDAKKAVALQVICNTVHNSDTVV